MHGNAGLRRTHEMVYGIADAERSTDAVHRSPTAGPGVIAIPKGREVPETCKGNAIMIRVH